MIWAAKWVTRIVCFSGGMMLVALAVSFVFV